MVLVFNGEIYNYQDLREELKAAGHEFVSNTDSETLIHGYEEWGRETDMTVFAECMLLNLGYKEEKIVCSERYFRNQTAILCEYEWYIDVCF